MPNHLLKFILPPFKDTDKIEIYIRPSEEATDVIKYDESTKRVQFMTVFEGQTLGVIHRLD